MILTAFPDLQWLKRQAEESFSQQRSWTGDKLPQKGWPNVILNVCSKHTYRDNIRGPLSLFMNLSGESIIEVNGKKSLIRDDCFFISNHDQYYTLEIDRKKESETFNIHFGEHFADQVLSAIQHNHEFLLDNQFNRLLESTAFHNRLVFKSDHMRSIIGSIHTMRPSGLALEEKLYEIMSILLVEEASLRKSMTELETIKTSTRLEIIKRLVYAMDFIYENLSRDITLENLAEVSCLSKFHFLRLFKTVYRKTPGKLIDGLRIKKACHLIKTTDMDITEIAGIVGYKNPSSFSRMFRNQTGIYPTQYRSY
jgi:AraC family transcriptional regulator